MNAALNPRRTWRTGRLERHHQVKTRRKRVNLHSLTTLKIGRPSLKTRGTWRTGMKAASNPRRTGRTVMKAALNPRAFGLCMQ